MLSSGLFCVFGVFGLSSCTWHSSLYWVVTRFVFCYCVGCVCLRFVWFVYVVSLGVCVCVWIVCHGCFVLHCVVFLLLCCDVCDMYF